MTDLVESLRDSLIDAEKFDDGNASAGTRVRKKLMEAKKDCDALRKQIQEIKNAKK
jgi:hypothetical protein